MWNNTRRGFNLIRKRNLDRRTKITYLSILLVFTIGITAFMIVSSSALFYRKKILHEMAYALDENNISTSIGDDQMSFVDVEVYMEEDINVAI